MFQQQVSERNLSGVVLLLQKLVLNTSVNTKFLQQSIG